MDLFDLEKYKNDDSQVLNSDSQVIFDDIDDDVKMCEMELKMLEQVTKVNESPMQTSQEANTGKSGTGTVTSCSQGSELDNEEEDVGFDVDINDKLKQLNSLLNPKKRGRPKKTSTPEQPAKGKKVKQNLKKPTGSKSAGVSVAAPTFSVPIRRARSDNSQQSATVPVVPVGRRRSGRLNQNDLNSIQESLPTPQSSRNNDPEVIDLVSAPPLVLPEIVNLDSDDEDKQKQAAREKVLADLSFEDNYEMSIKIRWKGTVQKHLLRKHQRFEDLLKKFAEQEKVDIQQIILTVGDTKIIQADDTPDSINYKISMILSGRTIDLDKVIQPKGNKKIRRDKNMIKVRLQADSLKQPVEIYIDKTRKFSGIRYLIAETLKVDAEKLKLKFDGESIDLKETPVDLEFDGGEMIDCILVK